MEMEVLTWTVGNAIHLCKVGGSVERELFTFSLRTGEDEPTKVAC